MSALASPGNGHRRSRPDAGSVPVCSASALIPACQAAVQLESGARIHRIPRIDEARGSLVFAEVAQHLPFEPKRFFAVFDVPLGEVRGGHAHRTLQEYLVCLRGAWVVTIDDGRIRQGILLDAPHIGLYLPPHLWRDHYQREPGSLLMVLASDVYRPTEHVRDYEAFVRMRRS